MVGWRRNRVGKPHGFRFPMCGSSIYLSLVVLQAPLMLLVQLLTLLVSSIAEPSLTAYEMPSLAIGLWFDLAYSQSSLKALASYRLVY